MTKRPKKPDGKLAKWPANWPQPRQPYVRDFPITTKELAAWGKKLKQRELF